jgi:hypothetical protein
MRAGRSESRRRGKAARQGSEALGGEHLAHGGGAQRCSLLLECLADFVDRIIALSQGYDLIMGEAFLRLLARTRPRGGKELRQIAMAKGMAQLPEGPG